MTPIARWESRTGKWFAELASVGVQGTLPTRGYSYKGRAGGGVFYVADDAEATEYLETLVETGIFQPDANTEPMRRVCWTLFDDGAYGGQRCTRVAGHEGRCAVKRASDRLARTEA